MSESPLVSIIILNHNGREWTERCLNSVLSSNYPISLLEIVLLNNGSNENDFRSLQETYGSSQRIRLLQSDKNLYFAGGNNLAASYARGEFLIFLNNDTVVERDWLKELVDFGASKKDALIQPKILFHDQPDTIDNAGGRYFFPGFGLGLNHGEKNSDRNEKPRKIDYAVGTCFLISRRLFEKLNGFDEWFNFHYEDVDLNLRAKKLGHQAWLCPSSIVFHRGSLTTKKFIQKSFLLFHIRRNRLLTILKNFHGAEKWLRFLPLLLFSLPTPSSVGATLDWQWRQLIEKIRLEELNKIIKKPGFSLLDIGSGDGLFARLAENSGVKVVALDPSPRGYYSKTIKSTIKDFSSEEKFDVVSLFHVLEHAEDPLEFLDKSASFLKNDGVLVVETPLVGNLTEKVLGRNYLAFLDEDHRCFFTEQNLLAIFNRVGLKIKKEGFVLLEFPFHLITAGFKRGFFRGLHGTLLFLPFKLLTILGKNKEIVRLYASRV